MMAGRCSPLAAESPDLTTPCPREKRAARAAGGAAASEAVVAVARVDGI